MSAIVSTDRGPRSSCCEAPIQIKKDYTDTHVYEVSSVDTDKNGKVIAAGYKFIKTYDGTDGENFEVTCDKCGQEITADIDWDEE